MTDITANKSRPFSASFPDQLPPTLETTRIDMMPIADTVSAAAARQKPMETLVHYNDLAKRLWIAPQVSSLAKELLGAIGTGRIAWGSLIGPYGFGKTATAITLWDYARKQGFLAIPPISCSSFEELAHGIVAMAEVQSPKQARAIRHLFEEVWGEGLDSLAERDAERYQLEERDMRRILRDKLVSGELTRDGQCHRLVEFISRLGKLASTWCSGLLIVLDELQQLLGPLDARSIVSFREFVWGIRTEQAPCGVILCMDTLLEMRLGTWAADLLHRIREQGVLLHLTDIYTKEFPAWLWQQAISNGALYAKETEALGTDTLVALGQFMERPDLASGPRTVVDVFQNALNSFRQTGKPYAVENLVDDLRQSTLRFFGEGAPVQRLLLELLADEWVREDEAREILIKTLIVFPGGCPEEILRQRFREESDLFRARRDLFGPLLVELAGGLALEGLQRVRRTVMRWEQVIAKSWDALPALDVLAAYAPEMVRQVLLPYLFPPGVSGTPVWQVVSRSSENTREGWTIQRGSFNDSYPEREVAVWLDVEEPTDWPADVDICMAFVCDGEQSTAGPVSSDHPERLLMRLPILESLEQRVPPELARFRKHLQPEPLRPVTLLIATQELSKALAEWESLGGSDGAQDDRLKTVHARAFIEITQDYLSRELLQSDIHLVGRRPLRLRGPELLHALFSSACRLRYAEYRTLLSSHNWQDSISAYCLALQSPDLSSSQRQGSQTLQGKKAVLAARFGFNSTAAFDSFQKSLGPLIEVSGDADKFSMALKPHPAEKTLVAYLRRVKTPTGIATSVAKEVLRHQGYLATEAEAIVSLLEARQVVTRTREGQIILVDDSDALRAQLKREVAEYLGLLERLGVKASLQSDTGEGASLPEWLERRGSLRDEMFKRIRELQAEAQNLDQRLLAHIGAVRALEIPIFDLPGDFQVHLQGGARTLVQTRESLLNEFRRLRERLNDIGQPENEEDSEWALRWVDHGTSIYRALEKMTSRMEEFRGRHQGLTEWQRLLPRIRMVRSACERVSNAVPGPLERLQELTRQYRELFSTSGWKPMLASVAFTESLSPIEAQVQTLLFSQWEAYLRESAELRRRYGFMLMQSKAPLLEPAQPGEGQDGLNTRFTALYDWAAASFEVAFEHCSKDREAGISWRHPTNTGKPWSKQQQEVLDALAHYRQAPDFETLSRAGDLVAAVVNGMSNEGKTAAVSAIIGLYDSPDQEPDFAALRTLYAEGKLRLIVERQNTR